MWQKDPKARRFTFSERLARIASELLDVTGVRLYHDQALYKEPAGGFTPWHADQQYWPMATAKSVTAWIPLQKTPMDMGPLEFARGSHVKNIGRDLAISDESETRIREMIKKEHLVSTFEPYDAGEVSFHLGWTLHRAGPNTTDQPRKVHTVIYMDEMMRMSEPKTPGQVRDANDWCAGTKVGEIIATDRTPVIWSSRQ
jgi:ectoine hydroxylase-related dioxygenase (phytanoyl-CoA dioxygenase family)